MNNSRKKPPCLKKRFFSDKINFLIPSLEANYARQRNLFNRQDASINKILNNAVEKILFKSRNVRHHQRWNEEKAVKICNAAFQIEKIGLLYSKI